MATHKRHTWTRIGGVKENPGVWSIKGTHPVHGGVGEGLRYDEECKCGARRTGYAYHLGGMRWTRTEWHVGPPNVLRIDNSPGGRGMYYAPANA